MNGSVERRDAARLEKPRELDRRKSSFSILENDLIGDRIARFSDTFATYSICIFLNWMILQLLTKRFRACDISLSGINSERRNLNEPLKMRV